MGAAHAHTPVHDPSKYIEEDIMKKLTQETIIRSVSDSQTQILKWTNMADLMRIRGVGEEYSELLEAAGGEQRGDRSIAAGFV